MTDTKEKDVLILAIESSCDETAAAVVKNGRQVLSNIIASQIMVHRKFGGVVPEIASRKHVEQVLPVIDAALAQAETPDYNRLYEADRLLHETWFAAMGKMYLWRTLQNAHADYSRFRMLDTMTSGGLDEVKQWISGRLCAFCGNSGVGKSTAIKHILLSEYMKGTRIIVIDPESEYRDLCQNLNGDWINAVGGSKGMINPLQVRPSPRDDEDEKEELRLYRDEGYGINELGNGQLSELAMHMKNLEIFFSLYIPSLTDMQKAVLKKCLVELYQKFHITWDTDVAKLKPQDFPIFSDLYALVQEKTKTEKENQVYTDLSMLLYDIAEGADSFIWNGHTTVSGSSRFTVMDTHALQETGDNIKRTQYFNILTYDWEQMSRDREERVLLICDEAYLMIDQKVPQSLVYLRNVMKRARKYEAALGIISHSLVDFLHESIKQYGQALLDIPCYKILMGTDGKNLKETADLYDLTEAEQELLLARKRGHALFMAGAKRLHIQFDIPEYKFNYMGKGGGR